MRLRAENTLLKEKVKGVHDVNLQAELATLAELARLRAENRSLKSEVQNVNIINKSILDTLTEVSQTNDALKKNLTKNRILPS